MAELQVPRNPTLEEMEAVRETMVAGDKYDPAEEAGTRRGPAELIDADLSADLDTGDGPEAPEEDPNVKAAKAALSGPRGDPSDLDRLSGQWGRKARQAELGATAAGEKATELQDQAMQTGETAINQMLQKNETLAAAAKVKMDQGAALLGSEAAHLEEFQSKREQLHTEWKRELKFSDVAMDFFRAPIDKLRELRAADEELEMAQASGGDPEEIERLQASAAAKHAEMEQYRDYDRSGPYKAPHQKILALIGVAMGGFVSGVQGGPNEAMQIFQQAFKDDIAMQREQYHKRKERRGRVDNEYSRMMEILGDDSKVEMAMMERMYKQTMLQVESLGKQAADNTAAGNLQLTLSGLQQGAADTQIKLHDSLSNRAAQALGQKTSVELAREQMSLQYGTGGPGGRELPAGEAAKVGEAKGAIKEIGHLEKSFKEKTDWGDTVLSFFLPVIGAKIQQAIGTDAGKWNDQREGIAHMLGRALIPDRFSDADRKIFAQALPYASEPDWRAKNKFKFLKEFSKARLEGRISELQAANFNVSGLDSGQTLAEMMQGGGDQGAAAQEAIIKALGE